MEKMSRSNTWDSFIKKGTLDIEKVAPVIANSWERSLGFRVDPLHVSSNSILEGSNLKLLMEQWGELIDAAEPFMQDLYVGIKGLGYTVILTDNQGYILHSLGDPDFVEKAQQVWLTTGANWSECVKGTNAIGTALHEKKSVNVFSWEHYCQENHFLACSAVPIFNYKNELLGVLDVTGDYRGADVRLLNLVNMAVSGIQREMTIRHLSGRLKLSQQRSAAIGEVIAQGIVTFDKDGCIEDVNNHGSKILGLAAHDCIGKPLEEILKKTGIRASMASYHSQGGVASIKSTQTSANPENSVRYTFESILGKSPLIEKTVNTAKRAAASSSTVLLRGETGTGKELFAQAIHHASGRKGAFVALNCAAIPEELIGSELFGYEAGAFTGAKQKGSAGKFELADGGTIFLDEIGDMPLKIQVALLRVLQERQVTRVGGCKTVPVDVRVIAATHQELTKRVAEGKFRQDLYYRLNVINLEIAPLRSRGDDVTLLAHHLLSKLSCRIGRLQMSYDLEVINKFKEYNWPGNIRELKNLIEGLVNTVEGSIITLGDLPEHFANPLERLAKVADAKPDQSKKSTSEPNSIKDVEAILIKDTIEKCGYNMSHAARSLGIGRTSLYRKIKEYKIFK